MTREEHYTVNLAAYYALRAEIEANYTPKQFVAIAGGKIVADDADFFKLQEKLTALGVGGDPMHALVERVGDDTAPRSVAVTYAGIFMGKTWPSSATATGDPSTGRGSDST